MSEDDEFVARRIEEIKHMNNWGTSYGQYPDHHWDGHTELLEPLTELVREYDGETARQRAAKALGWIGDERALDPLIETAEGDPSPEVRRAAVWGLRSLGDDGAVPALRAIAESDPEGDVRWQAGRALAVVEWEGKADYAVELLRGGDERAWEGFVREIGRDYVEDDGPVFEALRARIGDESVDEDRLIEGIDQFEDAGEILLGALDRDDPAVREAAIEGLRSRDERGALDRLRDLAAGDPVASVRASAVGALGYVAKSYEAVDELEPFVDDEEVEVRRTAVWQLRSATTPENVPPLVGALSDPDPGVRAKAAWGLKVAGHPGAVPELLDACSDENPDVRENAVLALQWIAGDLGRSDATGFVLFESETVPAAPDRGERSHSPDRARRILREALTDPDGDVRAQAVRTVGETGHPDGAALLAEVVREWDDDELRRRATFQLRSVAHYDVAVDALRAALDDEAPGVRAAAVARVRSLPDEEVGPAVREALRDESPDVRRKAAETARSVDDDVDGELRALLDREDDEEVRFAAKKALGSFGDE